MPEIAERVWAALRYAVKKQFAKRGACTPEFRLEVEAFALRWLRSALPNWKDPRVRVLASVGGTWVIVQPLAPPEAGDTHDAKVLLLQVGGER